MPTNLQNIKIQELFFVLKSIRNKISATKSQPILEHQHLHRDIN